jgi:hypothetical protein
LAGKINKIKILRKYDGHIMEEPAQLEEMAN